MNFIIVPTVLMFRKTSLMSSKRLEKLHIITKLLNRKGRTMRGRHTPKFYGKSNWPKTKREKVYVPYLDKERCGCESIYLYPIPGNLGTVEHLQHKDGISYLKYTHRNDD